VTIPATATIGFNAFPSTTTVTKLTAEDIDAAAQALIAALAPTFRLSAAAAASLAGQGAVVGTLATLGHVEVRAKSGLDLL